MTLKTLNEKGQSNMGIGRTLGVTEGAVRYHLRRAVMGAADGRRNKPRKAEGAAVATDHWTRSHGSGGESGRPVNVKALFEWLVADHRYAGSYKSVLRIDNLKTGIIRGAGPWGEINEAYRAYARSVGFHVDACLPRSPEDKGKMENKVGQVKRRLDLAGKSFDGLGDLQTYSDQQLAGWAKRRTCPATARDRDAAGRAASVGLVCRAGGGGAMSTTTKKTTAGPALDVDATREKLVQLGLCHAAESLAGELSEAVKHNRAAHQVLERLLAREVHLLHEMRKDAGVAPQRLRRKKYFNVAYLCQWARQFPQPVGAFCGFWIVGRWKVFLGGRLGVPGETESGSAGEHPDEG